MKILISALCFFAVWFVFTPSYAQDVASDLDVVVEEVAGPEGEVLQDFGVTVEGSIQSSESEGNGDEEVSDVVTADVSDNAAQKAEKSTKINAARDVSKMSSLFFTFWERNAIADAKRSRGKVRAPTRAELNKRPEIRPEDRVKPPPEKRDIVLGGIVYVAQGDWTIWLNGKRVTPDALPLEILDLNVHNEYIEMKWFDEWSNQIFPIRLKAHQRFNIDTRIFLPG